MERVGEGRLRLAVVAGWGRVQEVGQVSWGGRVGAPQLYMEVGSPVWLSLALLFQLPLPLIELMETEVLDILKKALSSEHPIPASTKDHGSFAGLGAVGFQDMYVLPDPLSTHKHPKDALKIKSQETRHRQTQRSE